MERNFKGLQIYENNRNYKRKKEEIKKRKGDKIVRFYLNKSAHRTVGLVGLLWDFFRKSHTS
jgi:hypothetical protein